MEGMVAARDSRLLWRGAALCSLAAALSTTTKLPPRVRHGVLPPRRKSPVTTAGASRAAQNTERWESPGVSSMV